MLGNWLRNLERRTRIMRQRIIDPRRGVSGNEVQRMYIEERERKS